MNQDLDNAGFTAVPFDQLAEDKRFEAMQNAATALLVRKSMGLLTEDEVAAILKLRSIGTLATWRSHRVGPRSVKLGKTVFYTQSGLGAWINQLVIEQDIAFEAAGEKVAA
jgi:hypothetical protein